MRRRTTTELTLPARTTVAELMAALEDVPQNGTVQFTVHPGNQRDPGYTTVTINHG